MSGLASSRTTTTSEPSNGWKWVGASNLCSWETGNPIACYANWYSNEPNDNRGEDIVELKGAASFCVAKWNDQGPDGTGIPGVIESEIHPSIPTVSEWGLMAIAVLVIGVGCVVMRRTRQQAA